MMRKQILIGKYSFMNIDNKENDQQGLFDVNKIPRSADEYSCFRHLNIAIFLFYFRFFN